MNVITSVEKKDGYSEVKVKHENSYLNKSWYHYDDGTWKSELGNVPHEDVVNELEELMEAYRKLSSDDAYTNEDMVKELIRVASIKGSTSVTTDDFSKNSTAYHHSTIAKRFGSWEAALKAAGLTLKKRGGCVDIALEDVVEDVKRVAKEQRQDHITAFDYAHAVPAPKYPIGAVLSRFRWTQVLEAAGIKRDRKTK